MQMHIGFNSDAMHYTVIVVNRLNSYVVAILGYWGGNTKQVFPDCTYPVEGAINSEPRLL